MENKVITWKGEDGLKWTAVVGIDNEQPCIFELSYETNGEKRVLAEKLHPQFKIVTGVRTQINPQREKGLAPGEELDYQWDTYSDDPMSRKNEVSEGNSSFNTTEFTYEKSGNRQTVTFNGFTCHKFSGGFALNFFEGTNLIRAEAVASTEENGVCYLYHGGFDGFKKDKLYYVTPKKREVIENPAPRTNSGPDRDRQRV